MTNFFSDGAMIKKLCPIGNSLGIIIDRSILDVMGITRETEIEMIARDGGLFIRPLDRTREDHKARVRKSAARMGKIHRKTLKKLAE